MFRTLMVPVDGSAFAEQALAAARDLSGRTGATIHLVRVHQPPVLPAAGELIAESDWLGALKADEQAYLTDLAAAPSLEGVRTETRLVEGFPVDALAAYAREQEIDLIVMTTHGRGGISRFWLGSVADALVRQANTPVLLIRPNEAEDQTPVPPPIRHILVPTDGSARSQSVLDPALALGESTGARFTVLRVLPPMPPMPRPWPVGYVAREPVALEEERERALAQLELVAAPLRERGVAMDCVAMTHVNPAAAILDFAATHSADAIALATRGRSGWARLAMGSVADKVMRGAQLPVLLYRPPAADTGGTSTARAQDARAAVHAGG